MLTLHLTLAKNQITVHANGKESHQFSLADLHWPQTQAEVKAFVANPREIGAHLFQALFRDGSPARAAFEALSKQPERTIVLVLESPELDGVAWEYAYNPAKEEYVVEDCAFVRALPETERPAKRPLQEVERVPLLFIPANPLVDESGEPLRALDVEGEWREMQRHIGKSNAPFDMLELRPATPEALHSMMARFQTGMIAHFSGHGAATREGAILLFEREDGAANPLPAREFVREVKDKAWIGFLSACQSAVPERTEFSNLARELAKAGVPFALGMQFNLPDPFAPHISGQFYNYLAHGHTVPEAARQARRAVKREDEFFVGMIALYAAHPDEIGRLSWRGAGAQTVSLFRPADVSDLPTPASGFIGRQRELMRLGARLLIDKKRVVTLHGAGGIGKTALLREALLRFAPSFDLTLAIGLDPLPSLESVLGRVERFLGLPSPCADDPKEREALVRNALTRGRALLGLDNFETLVHARDNGAAEEKKAAKSLYAFFQSLPAAGVTLCITSRGKTQLPGEHLEEIYGLEDALGGALFYENVSTRRGALTETGLEQLSAAVGGHPLALRLLAPIFEEQAGLSLEAFTEKLQAFLPQASDAWTEQERHASLSACFAFSLDNLPKDEEGNELRRALSRLSIFVGFFAAPVAAPTLAGKWPTDENEDKLQQDAAQTIVHRLWERCLLERVTVPLQNENFYLYRLHPALGQFAAERVVPEDLPSMQENHFRAMRQLAGRAYPASEGGGIYSSPFMAAIAHAALPDLLKATKLKQDKETSTLLYHLAFLLSHFGDLDGAMTLYQQSLQIDEGLGDLQGKAATLHNMAQIYVTRGDLDRAMTLYQQALQIQEGLGDLQGKSATLHNMAQIYVTRGDLDGAMTLYQQSLDIKEGLGDLQGKSDTLAMMAQIYVTRGDLDGAMKLYQQALQIMEGLGDLKGKAMTLGMMSKVYWGKQNYKEAIAFLLKGLMQLVELKIEPRTQQAMASDLAGWRNELGAEQFDALWKEITGQENVPEWLAQSALTPGPSPTGRGEQMSVEQFIAAALRAAREKKPEAEAFFKAASKMAADPAAPPELQALGKALQRLMIGEKNVDLSALPEEWREMIERLALSVSKG
ncbi:MAG: tetratricopeptide repeat protein [Anaerolineales bacterium]